MLYFVRFTLLYMMEKVGANKLKVSIFKSKGEEPDYSCGATYALLNSQKEEAMLR